jgi:hypothetical protein
MHMLADAAVGFDRVASKRTCYWECIVTSIKNSHDEEEIVFRRTVRY